MGNVCQDFFRDNADPEKELVPKLVKRGDGLELAKLSASAHSPGTVGLDETLCRQVIHPAFYDEELGEVTVTLYDDVCSRGMSINRLSYGSYQEFFAAGASRGNGKRTFIGLVCFSRSEVEDIQTNVDGVSPALRVFDTALSEDRSHADVCQATGPASKHALRKIRSAMWLAFKGRLKKAS